MLIADEEEVEEVVVVGSQIKGAKITGALPVSVITGLDIEATGVESGDDLLEHIAEQGQNYFTEAEDASGGVNAGRGDMGAYNLRNLGVGNTLTLLNGRRLVNSPGYQTELIGGDFVPTVTVNSNLIPVSGIERLEVLEAIIVFLPICPSVSAKTFFFTPISSTIASTTKSEFLKPL